ncbi:TPA: amidohydrolase [Candidatus Woesearchaeota archaeon]|nr:amidohydrolase [Candidatus Woesearchaeota archaeon]HII69518.1 amidohydrolase [Candidatus Woesearchaeota archaeon]
MRMTLLIKNAMVNGKKQSILIEGNRISSIGKVADKSGMVIDGAGKAAVPALFNCHTHAAMSLFRGYADDMPLHAWLNDKIWPLEAKLTAEDVYWGTKLAILEMIKTGTTFFNDMYWHPLETAKAAEEMGVRAAVSAIFLDFGDEEKAAHFRDEARRLFWRKDEFSPRIQLAVAPHSIYSVSRPTLAWARDFAKKHQARLHIHLSETEREVKDCVAKNGMRPIAYADDVGLLSERTIAAHCIWLDDDEIRMLAEKKVTAVYDAVSNMKLANGSFFPYDRLKNAGVNICLATDGAASSNALDMFTEMKVATILQKHMTGSPAAFPHGEVFSCATKHGAKAFGINAGVVAEGKLADILMIDRRQVSMVPYFDLTSNLVYSANGSVVDTTICDGVVLMEGRKVDGEEEIMDKADEAAQGLVQR